MGAWFTSELPRHFGDALRCGSGAAAPCDRTGRLRPLSRSPKRGAGGQVPPPVEHGADPVRAGLLPGAPRVRFGSQARYAWTEGRRANPRMRAWTRAGTAGAPGRRGGAASTRLSSPRVHGQPRSSSPFRLTSKPPSRGARAFWDPRPWQQGVWTKSRCGRGKPQKATNRHAR